MLKAIPQPCNFVPTGINGKIAMNLNRILLRASHV